MKNWKKTLIFFILSLIGLFLFIRLIIDIGLNNIISTITNFRIEYFLIFLFVSLINSLLFALRWFLIIKAQGYTPKFFNILNIFFAGMTFNYLTPAAIAGGEPVRILLLSKKEKILKREVAATLIIDKFLELSVLILFIFISVILIFLKGLIANNDIFILFVGLLIFFLVIFLFLYLTFKKRGFFHTIFKFFRLYKLKIFKTYEDKILCMEDKIYQFFTGHIKLLLLCLFSTFLSWGLKMFECFILLYVLGISLSFSTLFIITFLPMIAMLIPVPAGLGFIEGGNVVVFGFFGILHPIAMAFVIITRVRDIIFVFYGFLYTIKNGIKDLFLYNKN